jgi:hypothetical protein
VRDGLHYRSILSECQGTIRINNKSRSGITLSKPHDMDTVTELAGRSFGNDHQGSDGSGTGHALTKEDEYEHIASIMSIVITGVTILGAICIVTRSIRVILSLRTKSGSDKTRAKESSIATVEDSALEEAGGAKRMRGYLLIGLLTADAWVGISWLGPAVMGLRDQPLRGNHCDVPGFTLATALWWQYGFSIAIAFSTFFAIRHPLSTIKRLQEKYMGGIICLILLTGLVQAVLWQQLHGYSDWGQFCYYGSPRSRISEIMQFLPRLLSSFVIATTYAFLIRFLCRPDLTAQYSAPLPDTTPSTVTLCGGEEDGSHKTPKVTAPWEKMVLPDFSKLLDDDQDKLEAKQLGPFGSPGGRGAIMMSKHLRSVSNTSELTLPDRAWLSGRRAHNRSVSAVSQATMVSDTTLVPSISPSPDAPGQRSRSPSVLTMVEPLPLKRPTLYSRLRPSTAPAPATPISAPPPLMQATLSLPITIERRMSRSSTVTAGTANDISSFRGMLYDPSSSAETGSMGSRPPTPSLDPSGRIESMATIRNRRTWQLLMWFPMTVSLVRSWCSLPY